MRTKSARTAAPPALGPRPAASRRRLASLHRLTSGILVVGAAVSIGLGVVARLSYDHSEGHLTRLETELTASSLGVVQVDLERRLGGALDLARNSTDPVASFRRAIDSSMLPKGPFATSGLEELRGGHVEILTTLGSKPIANPRGRALTDLFDKAARTRGLVTAHLVGDGQQRLAYLLSLPGTKGTLVAGATQELPASRRVVVPASSPESGLSIAIYFGQKIADSALLETNAARTPLTGTTATAEIPFGDNVLTLVASPRTSLDGGWSDAVPWGILVVGLLFSLAIATMTERLLRRRELAERLAFEISALYQEQRGIAVTLQRAILPRQLPALPGVELAARYLPGAAGVEVGGDWYSAIRSGETTFAIVVGDVSGKGIPAAAVMASLRYTIRTLASLAYPPGEILEIAARELRATDEDNIATVLLGTIDTATRELTLASAGHLPPLLVTAKGASYLELAVGPPLGLARRPYETTTTVLPQRATLLGYTDGLVERRSRSLDVGLQRLRDAAAGNGASLEDLLTHVLGELDAKDSEDDIALLGVRL